MQSARPTLYELLCVQPKATLSEIRVAYLAAVKNTHPDKELRAKNTSLFVAQQQAWETLRDGTSRAAYDAELAITSVLLDSSRILEDVAADELVDGSFLCRCGGKAQQDATAGLPQVIFCDGCSLRFRLV